MTRWAVVYRHGAHRLAWLIVENVPAEVKRAQLLEALSTWRRWGRFAAVPAGVALTYLPEPRWGALDGVKAAPRVSWAELAPSDRRITLPVDGARWAKLTLASRRAGAASLQAWAAAALDAAAEHVLAGR